MLVIHAAEDTEGGADAPAGPSFEDWQVYDKAVKDAGIWVSGHALADLVTATKVRVDPGTERPVITDGPFAESREVLGGYYVIDVPDLDAALDWAVRCPGARAGSVVVRPVAEFEA